MMVRAMHAAGLEVILDVVYNHTAEGNQMGPTLSMRGVDNAAYYRLAPDPRYYMDFTGTGANFAPVAGAQAFHFVLVGGRLARGGRLLGRLGGGLLSRGLLGRGLGRGFRLHLWAGAALVDLPFAIFVFAVFLDAGFPLPLRDQREGLPRAQSCPPTPRFGVVTSTLPQLT